MFKYLSLVHKSSGISQGLSLTESQLGFKWSDAFDPEQFGHVDDWGYERAAVMFNIAAVLSFLATHEDRQTDDGIKRATQFFQQSAGMLSALRDIVKSAPWKASADLSSDTLATLQTLMLAQAQKCFYEKAEREGKSVTIVAKLAAECAGLYEDVSMSIAAARSSQRPISSMTNEWLSVVEWNRLLFDGMQHYHLSKVHLEKNEYGKQVARLTHAVNRCAEAVNACAAAAPVLREQFVRAHTNAAEAHRVAKKDNDLIYSEKASAVWRAAPFALSPPPPRPLPSPLTKPRWHPCDAPSAPSPRTNPSDEPLLMNPS